MILPVHIIGSPVLRQTAKDIDKDYPGLNEFLVNLEETMHNADGLGLAAPQVGKSIRVFMIDASPLAEDNPELEGFKKTFINAHIINGSEEMLTSNEGCLSVPGVYENVERHKKIRIKYVDENFIPHDEEYEGIKAVVIQHEYDHLDGILFTDKVSPLRKKLIKTKLSGISKGKFEHRYKFKLKA